MNVGICLCFISFKLELMNLLYFQGLLYDCECGICVCLCVYSHVHMCEGVLHTCVWVTSGYRREGILDCLELEIKTVVG